MISAIVNSMSGWHYLAVYVVLGLIASLAFGAVARAMAADD